jgi:formylglycine-generating enzyme required for sulfatase activity
MIFKIVRILISMLCLSVIFGFYPGESGPPPGMVLVKGGLFQMGSHEIPGDEEPVHHVTVNSFYIGTFEVTRAEWMAIMGNNPSVARGDQLPVENVDWYDAVEFCNKKSKIEGLTPCYKGSSDNIDCNFNANGYRLPTEAEWEYASRGGLQSRNYKFSGSNNADEVALYEKNLLNYFEPVGQRKPNELGIYDMSGNMWEWCWDWYDFDFYKNSPKKNPRGPLAGLRRVARGGGWNGPGKYLWSTNRSCFEPHQMSLIIGFRVVRTAK